MSQTELDMKTNQNLLEHYNKKYSGQTGPSSKIIVKNSPVDRNQAAIYWSKGGATVLEVGCGSGNLLFSLEDKYNQFIGIELSKPRYQHLIKIFNGKNNYKFINANIENDQIDIAENSIDCVIMTDVIEHLIDPIATLKKLHSIIIPGGELLIATPNIAKWTRRIKLLFGYFPSTASLNEGLIMYDQKTPTDLFDEGHLHYFTNRSLSKILKERIGFKSIQVKGYGIPVVSSLIPSLFSDCFIIAEK